MELSDQIQAELAAYDTATARFTSQQIPEKEFTPFRVLHGVYATRLPNRHMTRVKVPAGILTAVQLRGLAQIVAKYSSPPTCNGKTPSARAHLTTRQDIQIYDLHLADTPYILKELAEIGLTTREAGGNAIRNVKCCPIAGLHSSAPFDPTPYALAVSRYFLRRDEVIATRDGQPKTYSSLPRKIKIAFSGCCGQGPDATDCGQAWINDIGLFASTRRFNGQVVRGFRIVVGGGLSTQPHPANELVDFVPADEMIPWIDAIIRVFAQYGSYDMTPAGRRKARLKHLILEKGWEWFAKEAEGVHARLQRVVAIAQVPDETPARSAGHVALCVSVDGDPNYARWLKTAVKPTRHDGFLAVSIHVPSANLTPQQLGLLGDVAECYGDGTVRLGGEQVVMLRWIRKDNLTPLYAALRAAKLNSIKPGGVLDVTTCPGSLTCRIGITNSPGLGEMISEWFEKNESLVPHNTGDIHARVSGCPNSCSGHHVGTLGFHGAARILPAADGQKRAIPMTTMFLGGSLKLSGVTFGRQIGTYAVQQIPDVLKKLMELYASTRNEHEPFAKWAGRIEAEKVTAHLSGIVIPTPVPAEFCFDAGTIEPFVLGAAATGECAK